MSKIEAPDNQHALVYPRGKDSEVIVLRVFQYVVFWIFALLTGTAAGLLGVGGGEFRLPFLLYYFKPWPQTAAAVNLVVGLFTVSLAVLWRWGLHAWSLDDLLFTMGLAVASVGGAVTGARYAHHLACPLLRRIIVLYLFLVGLWMLSEALAGVEIRPWALQSEVKLVAGLALGFGIAFLSAIFGVAGGEMRIPALLYLFAVPIQAAGTMSLAASVPTVAAGALSYRLLGYLPRQTVVVALVMAAGSLLGVLIGTALLPHLDQHALKGILGLILLLATLALGINPSRQAKS